MRAYSFSLLRVNKTEHGHGWFLTIPPQWEEVPGVTRNRRIHAKYALYDHNPDHPHDDGDDLTRLLRRRPMPISAYYAIQDDTWEDRPAYTVHLYTIGEIHDDPTRPRPIWGVAWRRHPNQELCQNFWNEKHARAVYEAKCNE